MGNYIFATFLLSLKLVQNKLKIHQSYILEFFKVRNECWVLFQNISARIKATMVFLLTKMVYYSNEFPNTEPILNFWVNPSLSWWNIFLLWCCNLLANILFRILLQYSYIILVYNFLFFELSSIFVSSIF